jgi:GT2 family glycosyltransferase
MSKKVAVILVNWNSFSLTFDCIDSLQQMDYRDFDILVTDNGSQDRSGSKLKEHFPSIILIESPTNLGFTGGNNLGMQYAIDNGYAYVILLNNDTFVKDDFLAVLTTYMDQHPEAGAIQPMIYFNHNRSLIWNAGSYFNKWLGHTYTLNYNKPLNPENNRIKEVDWVSGCAFMTRVAILKKTGLFPENLFIYYEDVDLSFRIKQEGFQLVFHPESVIYHIAGMSNRNKIKGKEGFVNPIVHYLNIRNRIWLLKRYTSPAQAFTVSLFNFFYIIALMAYFVVRLRFTKLKTVIRAIKDGMKGEINYK